MCTESFVPEKATHQMVQRRRHGSGVPSTAYLLTILGLYTVPSMQARSEVIKTIAKGSSHEAPKPRTESLNVRVFSKPYEQLQSVQTLNKS